MSWTDERVETLKRMWNEGQSASQIAKELGGCHAQCGDRQGASPGPVEPRGRHPGNPGAAPGRPEPLDDVVELVAVPDPVPEPPRPPEEEEVAEERPAPAPPASAPPADLYRGAAPATATQPQRDQPRSLGQGDRGREGGAPADPDGTDRKDLQMAVGDPATENFCSADCRCSKASPTASACGRGLPADERPARSPALDLDHIVLQGVFRTVQVPVKPGRRSAHRRRTQRDGIAAIGREDRPASADAEILPFRIDHAPRPGVDCHRPA